MKNPSNLLAVKFNEKSTQVEVPLTDNGLGAKTAVNGLPTQKIHAFQTEAKLFLETLYGKLIEKCPLREKIVKGATCLSPTVMLSEGLRKSRVDVALEEFTAKRHVTATEADYIKRDYIALCEDTQTQTALREFDQTTERIDVLLINLLQRKNDLGNKQLLLQFFQKILTLFHGNAAVERSFSVNKECLVENLHEHSLVAQRSVYGAVEAAGGVLEVDITRGMILAAKSASSKRQAALKEQKSSEEEQLRQRRDITTTLKKLEAKKRSLLEKSNEEQDEIDKEIAVMKKKLKR